MDAVQQVCKWCNENSGLADWAGLLLLILFGLSTGMGLAGMAIAHFKRNSVAWRRIGRWLLWIGAPTAVLIVVFFLGRCSVWRAANPIVATNIVPQLKESHVTLKPVESDSQSGSEANQEDQGGENGDGAKAPGERSIVTRAQDLSLPNGFLMIDDNSTPIDSKNGQEILRIATEYLEKLKGDLIRIEVIGNGDPGGATNKHASHVVVRNGIRRTANVVSDLSAYFLSPGGLPVCKDCNHFGFFMHSTDALVFVHSDDTYLEPAPIPPRRRP
jgi:hypothetical protein